MAEAIISIANFIGIGIILLSLLLVVLFVIYAGYYYLSELWYRYYTRYKSIKTFGEFLKYRHDFERWLSLNKKEVDNG